jgi:DNA-binding response OmpR family regulator
MNEKKILIIDDEFPVRYLVEHQLRRKGFDVQAAKNGPTGLQAAREYKPDLIVLDIMMPEMDGFQVCQEIRNDPELYQTPVIFLTACMTKKHKLQAFDVGGDDYLLKPFQAEELLAHITAVLRRIETRGLAEEAQKKKRPSRGRIITLYSPKGGVGTTTISVQLSEALAMQEDRTVMLIDLDLPLGGIAPMLSLYAKHHIVELLNSGQDTVDMELIHQFTQRHRRNLFVIPTPDQLLPSKHMPSATSLQPVLDKLVDEGYYVILDVGSTLTDLTLTAMRQAHLNYIISSGQPVANKLNNTFLSSAERLGLEANRLMPVVNELHGTADDAGLLRMPIARIPHTNERSRTKLWVTEQGLRKLVSVAL